MDLVGLLLIFEWTPRILFTLMGSTLIYRAGIASSYIRIELLRAVIYVSLLVFLLIPSEYTKGMLMIMLPLLQVALALILCIGEAMMTYLAPGNQARAQTTLRLQDMKGKLWAFPISILLVGVLHLYTLPLAIAASVCLYGAWLVHSKHRPLLDVANKPELRGACPITTLKSSWPALKTHFQCGLCRNLTLFSILLTTPAAVVSATLPFYLASTTKPAWMPIAPADPMVFILVLVLESLLVFGAIKWVGRRNWESRQESWIIRGLLATYAIGLVGLVCFPSFSWRVLSLTSIFVAYATLMVMMRVWRQSAIPERSRIVSTGVAISVESTGYVFAGAWLVVGGANSYSWLLLIPILAAACIYLQAAWSSEASELVLAQAPPGLP